MMCHLYHKFGISQDIRTLFVLQTVAFVCITVLALTQALRR